MTLEADFIVIGAGSAGCIVAAELARREAGSVLLIEAGPSDAHPLVSMPFGLVWLMGSKRDWSFQSTAQTGLNGRRIPIPRGRMLGGSGSINSMVWFRGRADDFDGWAVRGWSWASVTPAYEAIEAQLHPAPLDGAHPLVHRLAGLFDHNANRPPSPERESAGVFRFNLSNGKRRSSADGFLRPAQTRASNLRVVTNRMVKSVRLDRDRARWVQFDDGSEARAEKGIVLSAGAIGSPAILLRSGIGPRADMNAASGPCVVDAPGVGANLHDHPAVGLHYQGDGYGLTFGQAGAWLAAPFRYGLGRGGRFASPTVEGGLFFNARGDDRTPDIQSHVIPFNLGWKGRRYRYGAGFFADVCLCRPRSRGRLRLGAEGLKIDLGLLTDPADLQDMVAGVHRLRALLAEAGLNGVERFPGHTITTNTDIAAHIRAHAATAYHPVGTLRMGADADAPVAADLRMKNVAGLWVADASVMPRVTSANTNAPAMMIGYRAAQMIAEAA